jgi:hypothetical protein
MVRTIGHNQVRGAYGDEIESRIASMRSQTRGKMASSMPRQIKRPQTGLMHRHRAILTLILMHPAMVPANFEALSMLESSDLELNKLKKAIIDAVIRNPDLDAEALSYHLQCLKLSSVVEEVTGEDMKSRLPFDPKTLPPDQALVHLEELLGLADGKSGLFSRKHAQRH